MVPEATNVDEGTLNDLVSARPADYYLSDASPLGVPFNNFSKSTSESQRLERMAKGRPGSPCHKKFLVSNTEFTKEPICTASRKYQHLKIKQLDQMGLSLQDYEIKYQQITGKDCLCEGLGASVRIKDGIPLSNRLAAVSICPGPNLVYFSGVFSLSQMVGHIYGRLNILNSVYRPNMFVNELNLYVDYFRKKLEAGTGLGARQIKSLNIFKDNLLAGIEYYKGVTSSLKKETSEYITTMKSELEGAAQLLKGLKVPEAV
jgi:hypothetical protein